MALIQPTSCVEGGGGNGANGQIGPVGIVGPQVEIGDGTVLKSLAVVTGHTKIGRANAISQFSSTREANRDLKYAGEPTPT